MNENPNLIKNFNPISINIGILEGFSILLASVFAGLLIRYIYKKYSSSLSSKSGLGNTILMVTISVAALIAVVKSSLALSLGLVGALSVVRFRTAIKEPYNLSFILFAICVGISIGASQFSFAFLITVVGSSAAFLINRDFGEDFITKGSVRNLDTVSIRTQSELELDKLYEILNRNSYSYIVKTLNNSVDGNISITLGITLRSHQELNELIKRFRKEIDGIDLTFYSSPYS